MERPLHPSRPGPCGSRSTSRYGGPGPTVEQPSRADGLGQLDLVCAATGALAGVVSADRPNPKGDRNRAPAVADLWFPDASSSRLAAGADPFFDDRGNLGGCGRRLRSHRPVSSNVLRPTASGREQHGADRQSACRAVPHEADGATPPSLTGRTRGNASASSKMGRPGLSYRCAPTPRLINISRASCHVEIFAASFRWLGDGIRWTQLQRRGSRLARGRPVQAATNSRRGSRAGRGPVPGRRATRPVPVSEADERDGNSAEYGNLQYTLVHEADVWRNCLPG